MPEKQSSELAHAAQLTGAIVPDAIVPLPYGEGIIVDGLRVEFEIRAAAGAEARHVALEQARAFREVLEWLTGRKRSETGPDLAA